MKFSWLILGITMAIVIIEGIVSFFEGTFISKQHKKVNLSFLKHWGVSIGDLLILPIVNGLIFPYLCFSKWYIPGIILAGIITLVCHIAWCPNHDDINAQGFILNSQDRSNLWYKAMTRAGWIHFGFMVCELTILGGYILTPMPLEVIKIVFVLFCFFIPVAITEPGIVQKSNYIYPTVVVYCLVFLITIIKLL